MIKKVIFQIKGMHCSSCAMNIDGELEDSDGVQKANTSYARGETEVEFDDAKVNEERLISIIRKIDYDAVVKAS